ncbi:MAG: TonB-dependent receptor [Acidobacteria bacterium]|nr:TonB-dependent receptor [Acidobacteriota bacterium]
MTDQSGARVAGATINLVSESFQRTVTTDDQGFFRALQMRPGTYTVSATATNFQPYKQDNVQVILGRTTPLNIKLAVGPVGAEVTVTGADEIAIDPTASRIQTNLTQRELELLPKGTNFTSALKAVPAVREEPSAAGFAIDGATGVENSFIIDGQEVANFRTGRLNTNNNLPFQLVQEIQVKTSGFAAEFGGATGGVINVITRGGGNEFHGQAGAEFRAAKLQAGPRPILGPEDTVFSYIYPRKDEGTDFFPFVSLGGPIIKDRLWFFGSATPQFFHSNRLFTFPDGTRGEFRSEQRNNYYFGRIDAAITDNFRIYSTYTHNPIRIRGLLPSFTGLSAASTLSDSAATDPASLAELGGRQPSSNFAINGTFVATSDLVFSARFSRGYINEKLSNYGIPNVTRFQCVTAGFQCDAGFNNVATNDRTIRDISIRKNYEADASYILNEFLGRHQFKGGYQRFHIKNDVASGYVEPGRVLFYFGRTTAAEDGTIFGNRPGEVGYARLVLIGEFGKASSSNDAIYLQDTWQPFSRLTLNLGVRTEKETVPSFTEGFPGIKFGFGDKIAPRLGFAFDVLGNGRFKIFANYGQFFDRFKYELPRGSFGGNIFDDYRAPLLASQPDIFAYTKQYVLDNALVYTNFRVPSNDPDDFRVDPDLKPVKQTEYTAGAEYSLGSSMVVRARYTRKQMDQTIEDIGYHDENGDEAYFIGNPGSGICELAACGRYPVGAPAAKPERQYDAFEINLDKRFADAFAFNASYTFSRLYGNYSGLASTDEFSVNGTARDSPNVNRFFDTPFGAFNVGGEPNNGRLPTDRPHAFKFFGAYTFGRDSFLRLPSNNELELSGFYTLQSGTPITTRVDLIDDAYIILNGRGDLGRTERYSQADLALTFRHRFGRDNRYAMQFNVDVLNAFNQANVLAQFEAITQHTFQPEDFAVFGVDIADRQDFDRAFFDGRITSERIMRLIDEQFQTGVDEDGNPIFETISRDARFDQPQFFQAPRSVRFGFRFQF